MAQTKRTTTSKKRQEPQGRIPPHSLEMERALLCSALIDPNGFARAVGIVNPESFYDRKHSLIFAAMERLFRRGAPIDMLTVSDELSITKSAKKSDQTDLELAGDDAYLRELTNEVATSAHVESYSETVRDRKSLRDLIISATAITSDAYSVPNAEELIDRAMSELFTIYREKESGGFESIAPVLLKANEYLDKLHQRKGDSLTGIGTGFKQLDDMTSGFQNGDFIVLAGRPSMGKTAFALDLARHACKKYSTPVAFFSLEMASMAIAMRLLAAEAHLDLHRLRSGRLPDNAWARLSLATGDLSEMPFFIDDSGTLGIMEVRARARMLKQQHDIGIIFIDYLQLMKPPKADSREQEVAQISRALKGLARELDIPVVAMSQLSRAVEQRGGDKRPQLSDLRDSGAIEQDADVVMFIYRRGQYQSGEKDGEGEIDEDDGSAEIIIRKQRNGPTGTVHLLFHKEYAHFVQKEPGHMLDDKYIEQEAVQASGDAPF